MNILVLNGPNLNLLGKRSENHYGTLTLDKIEAMLNDEFPEINFDFFQSNHEGELVEKIQGAGEKYSGLIINPGGYAHSSVAIHDALEIQAIPKIEVHLSHLSAREDFRQKLITSRGCTGYISGFKENSYSAAVYLIKKLVANDD